MEASLPTIGKRIGTEVLTSLPAEAATLLPEQRWILAPANPNAAELAAELGLPPVLAQVLINRGLGAIAEARNYLQPEQQELPDPREEFEDLVESVLLLEEAIREGDRIAICGDYDADGMTSTALLLRTFRHLNAKAEYAIPSRMQEGYGINERIVEEFAAAGVRVVLTVDNGIAAQKPIARARELGLTVIVTDHHDLPPELPPANAILNPKLLPEDSPYYGLAGVGVAYVLALCVAEQFERQAELIRPLLELYTLGTIADLAPLTGVNRRWLQRGLRLLPKSQLLGIQALMSAAGVEPSNRSLKPEDIGFKLGPRINAIGRIGDPQVVIELLTTEDRDRAQELAQICEATNRERQTLCTQITEEAIAIVEAEGFDNRQTAVLVLAQPDWHHGVIGIVASRLVERYGVPVFISTYEDDGHLRGSARGTPEFDVFAALEHCRALLGRFGGHRAAGGFSLPAENLSAWRSRLQAFAVDCLPLDCRRPALNIDVELSLDQASLDLFEQQQQLQPFGIGNNEPLYWTQNVAVLEQRRIGQNQDHLKLTISRGSRAISGLFWRWGDRELPSDRLDIAYYLRENFWNDRRELQLEIVGLRATQATSQPLTFLYGDRTYQITATAENWYLTNSEGAVLRISSDRQKGFLQQPNQEPQPIDLQHPYLQGLIQTAAKILSTSPIDSQLSLV
ncbi:single-stranded-DNA-specific exonuclease RecJ [Synechococcus elongatus IITB4]|uniref:single-stranded-DNA-specific exonuclease RecJ n=1 Tax=Synechococcus elongatus TaxID=32046 RepID=UPI0030CDCC9C